jgi:hypothetical protein
MLYKNKKTGDEKAREFSKNALKVDSLTNMVHLKGQVSISKVLQGTVDQVRGLNSDLDVY